MGTLFSIIQSKSRKQDLKASVPRLKPREEPKVKTVQRTVFSESVDQRLDKR